MMKIGIITIHHSPNYGASLQSYALWKYVSGQGGYCEVIDLHRPFQKDYVRSRRYRRMRPLPLGVRLRILAKKALCATGLWADEAGKSLFSDRAKGKFDAFNAQVRLSVPYRSIEALYASPPAYDLYISGSDQVWNPTQNYCLEPYFLTFVPSGRAKKISYASSIGITALTEREKRKFREWLSSYDAISVREKQAKDLLESVTGLHVTQVPDPTFLIDVDDWMQLAVAPDVSERYILLFRLDPTQLLFDYALRLSRESGLRLVVLDQMLPEGSGAEYQTVTDAGPREFIGYVAHADMVVTDSFHCTVFSILTGARNFYSYIAPTNRRGSRITDLLDTFSMRDHLLPAIPSASYRELADCVPDRQHELDIIAAQRNRGRDFLNRYVKP